MLELPNGQHVRCWKREGEAIRRDVMLTGNVYLVKDPATEVYNRVAPDSVEATVMENADGTKRIS